MNISINDAKHLIESAWLLVAVPFLVGFLIILGLHKSKPLSMMISIGAVGYGFIHAVLIVLCLAQHSDLGPWQANYDWFTATNLRLCMGYLVDNLAAMMLVVVTAISLLVQIYTHGYMKDDPGYSKFYAYLSLFTASMLGLVVSTNLFETYFFWELVGVCSYFLIGFWWQKESAAQACLKAFIVNRIGDFGFLLGIIMFLSVTRTLWCESPILAYVSNSGRDLGSIIIQAYNAHLLTAPMLSVIALLIFLGPMAKSAQAPLHVWLPDAMEGPTPISALIHAATMVAAGIYLVARAYPLWLTPDGSLHSLGLTVVAWVGGFTAFMAATIALSQFDIKRVLAWSTVSQLGYMFVGLGCGAFSGGLFHLFNHAFFKAMLFLCSGAVIHGLHGEQDIRKMGGLFKSMPITATCFLIGTLSISGCPGLSGFFSKDEIISASIEHNLPLGILMIVTAAMTSFYMFRLFFLTFVGEFRGHGHPHESPLSMTGPLMALAIPSIFSGYLGVNLPALFQGRADTSFFPSFVHFGSTPIFEEPNLSVMAYSTIAAILGFVLAFMIYKAKSLSFNTAIVESKNTLVQTAYKFSLNKWYFDELYLSILQNCILPVYKKLWETVDVLIVDSMVNLSGLIALGLGEVMRYFQNGRAQFYAFVIFFGIVALTTYAYYFVIMP